MFAYFRDGFVQGHVFSSPNLHCLSIGIQVNRTEYLSTSENKKYLNHISVLVMVKKHLLHLLSFKICRVKLAIARYSIFVYVDILNQVLSSLLSISYSFTPNKILVHHNYNRNAYCKCQVLRLIHRSNPSRCHTAMTTAHNDQSCTETPLMCRCDFLCTMKQDHQQTCEIYICNNDNIDNEFLVFHDCCPLPICKKSERLVC